MADICLVSLPTLVRAKSTIVPHWMLWLSGYLEQQGYKVDVVDVKSPVNSDYSEEKKRRIFEQTIEKAIASRSPLIGLSGFTEDFQNITQFAKALRQRTEAKIIAGGIHATISPEDYFIYKNGPFDIAVKGDGEIPLARIIESERQGSYDLEKIDGLVFRKGNDIIRTAPQSSGPELGDMHIHPYHKLDMDFYLQPQQSLLRSIYLSGVHIFTARGCPYSCTFCANSRKKVRYRPIDSVIREIKYLKETYDIDGFYIHDDTFSIKSERITEFCEELMSLNYNLVWGMEGRVNQFPDTVLRALKKSGCIQIDFGVESGSQEALNRMKKGITVSNAVDIFQRCRHENIRTYANFLINTPEETEEDVRKTVDLMGRLRASTYGICVTTPYPGTEIYDQYVKPALTVDEYQLYSDSNSYVSIVDPRFRLAAHNLNIEELSARLCKRFMLDKGWQIISLHPLYILSLLKSGRKFQYARILFSRVVRKFRNMTRHFLPGVK